MDQFYEQIHNFCELLFFSFSVQCLLFTKQKFTLVGAFHIFRKVHVYSFDSYQECCVESDDKVAEETVTHTIYNHISIHGFQNLVRDDFN